METRIVKEYIYEGLGFPVLLRDVTFVKIDKEWHPQIDVKQVAEDHGVV